MGVDIGQLYDWLAAPHERRLDTANDLSARSISFNQLLWYVAVGIGVLLFVIEVIALTNGLALARTITSSVDQLFMGTERVKSGDFTARVAVQSDDQLGQLAGSFNDMTGRIEGLLREQDEKRRLEEELRIARQMQMSLLPGGILNAPGVSVAALCAPAREVGGDYYDFLRLPDGRIGLLIADVSGKGTSAAFYMAELKGLMLSLSRTHTSPRALLIEANRIIAEHLDSRSFITATYAVLDPAARFLTCARAGHAPFVRVFGQPGPSQPAEVLAPDGMVLGLNLDGGERFERCLAEIVIPLASGDLFCFYTDGVSEAMDGTGDCFGEQRLTDFLLAHSNLPPPLIRDRLLDELRAFACGQPQHDDITMIVMKIGEPLGDGRAGDRDGRHG
jgi:sigma-B regulation protein RsbU (phosphoserine phosphatase)